MKSIAHNKRFFQIKGNKAWILLHNKIIPENTVEIVNCTNLRIAGPVQFNATKVFVQSCDVVLQRWWLDIYQFPYVKHIYIDSEYEPIAYNRFDESVQIYVTEEMVNFKPFFLANDYIKVGKRFIKVITKEHMNFVLNNLKQE